jgi:hypothetical protein
MKRIVSATQPHNANSEYKHFDKKSPNSAVNAKLSQDNRQTYQPLIVPTA